MVAVGESEGDRKVVPAQFSVLMTSENNPKANYRFFSGSSKPGFRDSCHANVIAACQGIKPPSLLLQDGCVCRSKTSLRPIPLVSCGHREATAR